MRQLPGDQVLPVNHEGPADITRLLENVQAGLGPGAARPYKEVRDHPGPQALGQGLRNYLCLVVAPAPHPCPVERDRDYQVHIGKEGRGAQFLTQDTCEKPSRPEVGMVFQALGNLAVPVS